MSNQSDLAKSAAGFNGDPLSIDTANNRVGIGTSSIPAEARAMVSGGRFYVNSQDQYSVLLQNSGTSGGFIGTTAANTINFFNPSGTERMRILPGGGITFNGDTATANALDDYEEGTFTPTSRTNAGTAATFGTSVGQYTKIGNVVYFNMDITNIDTTGTTSSSQLQIDGLPFTVDVDSTRAFVLWDNITFQSTRTSCVATVSLSEYIQLNSMGTGIADTPVDYGDLNSGVTDVFITGFYYTNQ